MQWGNFIEQRSISLQYAFKLTRFYLVSESVQANDILLQ